MDCVFRSSTVLVEPIRFTVSIVWICTKSAQSLYFRLFADVIQPDANLVDSGEAQLYSAQCSDEPRNRPSDSASVRSANSATGTNVAAPWASDRLLIVLPFDWPSLITEQAINRRRAVTNAIGKQAASSGETNYGQEPSDSFAGYLWRKSTTHSFLVSLSFLKKKNFQKAV